METTVESVVSGTKKSPHPVNWSWSLLPSMRSIPGRFIIFFAPAGRPNQAEDATHDVFLKVSASSASFAAMPDCDLALSHHHQSLPQSAADLAPSAFAE